MHSNLSDGTSHVGEDSFDHFLRTWSLTEYTARACGEQPVGREKRAVMECLGERFEAPHTYVVRSLAYDGLTSGVLFLAAEVIPDAQWCAFWGAQSP